MSAAMSNSRFYARFVCCFILIILSLFPNCLSVLMISQISCLNAIMVSLSNAAISVPCFVKFTCRAM